MSPVEWNDLLLDPAVGPERGSGAREAWARTLLEQLNEAQTQAVAHSEGPLLILAGAGSGKTRVITRRVAHLVASGRARPEEILAITFTNRAAREMKERVLALDPAGPPGPHPGPDSLARTWISTYHALGARLLRREIDQLPGYSRDFTIYDTQDKNDLIKSLIKEAGYDPQRFRPAMVGSWISQQKNQLVESWEDTREFYEEAEALEDGFEAQVLKTVARLYDQRCRASNALDFDDLLLRNLELFERSPGTRDRYAAQFRYVLVDEYQDTNRVQYQLTRHLAMGHGNLAVCGDPDQSIYAWRGADVRNILEFERDFPGALVVKLEHNYRSTARILRAAQGVIEHNVHRKSKHLLPTGEEGQPIELIEAGDENDESDAIASRIRGLLRDHELVGARPLDQVAVFYRANFLSRAVERGLRLEGLPYQIAGGVEFYARREIRDLVAYLQLVVNPADDVAFRRVVNVPMRGIGDKSLEQLTNFARERGQSLLRAVQSEGAEELLKGRAKAGLKSLVALIGLLAEAQTLGPAGLLKLLIEETGYYKHLSKTDEPGADSREENVQELIANARLYERESPDGGLSGFLAEVALVSDLDGLARGVDDPSLAQGSITLMTLHSAKGLEFDVVFIAGCEEDLLPHARALEEDDGGGGRGLEEERRLFYVGMTRARRRLFLSQARSRMYFGETSWRRPSRFLEELPPGVLEQASEEEDERAVLGEFKSSGPSLNPGDWVRHGHFGLGQVERLAGSGANARATVRFNQLGQKTLLLQYAQLERVQA